MKFHKDGSLPDGNQIWVFGSNLAGAHGAGAARVARERFGAQLGVGVGMTGWSYAIPTKDRRIQTLPIDDVMQYVDEFKNHARSIPRHEFFVTAIGCGLAGFTAAQIAPMFKDAPSNCSLPHTWREFIETTPIAKQRLLNVAKALRESSSPAHFSMTQYGHSCGTPACALGHYAARRDLQDVFYLHHHGSDEGIGADLRTLDGFYACYYAKPVREHFDITHDEAEELFSSAGCGASATPIAAATYIENFVARKYDGKCCANERRTFAGGCSNCGDPSL